MLGGRGREGGRERGRKRERGGGRGEERRREEGGRRRGKEEKILPCLTFKLSLSSQSDNRYMYLIWLSSTHIYIVVKHIQKLRIQSTKTMYVSAMN